MAGRKIYSANEKKNYDKREISLIDNKDIWTKNGKIKTYKFKELKWDIIYW